MNPKVATTYGLITGFPTLLLKPPKMPIAVNAPLCCSTNASNVLPPGVPRDEGAGVAR